MYGIFERRFLRAYCSKQLQIILVYQVYRMDISNE